MKKVLVIAGVTGSGKTKLGIELANTLNGEIISADSVAIYRDLNIGSAKPDAIELSQAKHHMIDILDVNDSYSVAQFQKDARALIDDITSRGKLPIVVGGTGLYINALINDYDFVEDDQEELENESSYTDEQLYRMLLDKDPEAAKTIHQNNRKRVIRALIKKPNMNNGNTPVYDALVFFLQSDRELIHERINLRVDKMFESGLEEELRNLLKNHPQLFSYQGVQSIGYREFEGYFKNEITIDEVRELIKRNTRRFAKRQITWFKNKTNSIWIDIKNPKDVINYIKKWL